MLVNKIRPTVISKLVFFRQFTSADAFATVLKVKVSVIAFLDLVNSYEEPLLSQRIRTHYL